MPVPGVVRLDNCKLLQGGKIRELTIENRGRVVFFFRTVGKVNIEDNKHHQEVQLDASLSLCSCEVVNCRTIIFHLAYSNLYLPSNRIYKILVMFGYLMQHQNVGDLPYSDANICALENFIGFKKESLFKLAQATKHK